MTLAEMCGTSTSYIGQIEIGNRFPSIEMIEKIAEALNAEPYLLFVDGLEAETIKKPLPAKSDIISSSVKNKLVKSLNAAIKKVVNQLP